MVRVRRARARSVGWHLAGAAASPDRLPFNLQMFDRSLFNQSSNKQTELSHYMHSLETPRTGHVTQHSMLYTHRPTVH